MIDRPDDERPEPSWTGWSHAEGIADQDGLLSELLGPGSEEWTIASIEIGGNGRDFTARVVVERPAEVGPLQDPAILSPSSSPLEVVSFDLGSDQAVGLLARLEGWSFALQRASLVTAEAIADIIEDDYFDAMVGNAIVEIQAADIGNANVAGVNFGGTAKASGSLSPPKAHVPDPRRRLKQVRRGQGRHDGRSFNSPQSFDGPESGGDADACC